MKKDHVGLIASKRSLGAKFCLKPFKHLGLIIGFSATFLSISKAVKETGGLVDYFTNNGFGNAVAVVQQPAGIHYEGVTYVSYQGPLEDPYVASYNHDTGDWKGPFKAGVSEMGKDPNRPKKIDNHGKPTMIIDDEGFIHIFYGGHGGMPVHGVNKLGNHHYGRNKHSVSKSPLDITQWEDLDTITPFGTYNQAVKMDNGDIYLFYRHGAHRSDWTYQKSSDNGRSFSPSVSFLKHKRRDDLQAVDSWYAYVYRGRGDDIIVAYDYHLCWDVGAGIDGRGHTTERHDVYYMVFDTKTDIWRNVEGDELEMPIVREYADKKTLVARTGNLWTFNGSVRLDSKGFPHIATNIGKDLGEITGGPKQTSHYRWTGKKWIGGVSVAKMASRGDFMVKHSHEISYILAYGRGGYGVVSWWHSEDGGSIFTKGEELLRRRSAGWAISSMINNAHPDARVLVAEKSNQTDYRNMYILGDNGPVKRPKSEADHLGH